MESGKKWYMIRHNRCSAVFAIDQVAFYNSFLSDSSEREKKVICPNCFKLNLGLCPSDPKRFYRSGVKKM